MLKILAEMWGRNKEVLKKALETTPGLNNCNYQDIVRLAFENIYNTSAEDYGLRKLDLDNITIANDGDYQGTLLFLIPFDTYQPSAEEYLMTYIWYGSCDVCDVLMGIQDVGDGLLEHQQVDDFMYLSLHIIQNTVKPYSHWSCGDSKFANVEGVNYEK